MTMTKDEREFLEQLKADHDALSEKFGVLQQAAELRGWFTPDPGGDTEPAPAPDEGAPAA